MPSNMRKNPPRPWLPRCQIARSSITCPAYITATRVHRRATTPRSCVTTTIAPSTSPRHSPSSATICRSVVASSAVVGSSATSSAGVHSSAAAIATR
jgi:hypothetical protein